MSYKVYTIGIRQLTHNAEMPMTGCESHFTYKYGTLVNNKQYVKVHPRAANLPSLTSPSSVRSIFAPCNAQIMH